MRKVLMGLAGLGLLVFGASANASPLSTGTNMATPATGASELVDQVQYREWRGPRRHYGWDRGRHRGWYGNPGRHRGWGHGHGRWRGHGHGHGHGRWH
jgi:hypothetical protein